jgi:hypothetical protein
MLYFRLIFFCRHIARIEKWMCCVTSCGMTSYGVSRGAVTSFEFRIAVENICGSTDAMIEIFRRHLT